MRWENSVFYPDKYRNLHGCRVMISRQPAINAVARNIFITLANLCNFTISYKVKFIDTENVKDSELDLMEMFTTHNVSNGVRAISSVTVFLDSLNFIISSGEPYSQFEKMFMMFENEVWIAIGATLLTALFLVYFVKLLSIKALDLICGSNIKTPALNLVSTFLTGIQSKLPKNSLARFLLMMFIFWSLIFRTCHQSMLFTYLQADLRKATLTTIDEIFEHDLTLYGDLKSDEIIRFENKETQ